MKKEKYLKNYYFVPRPLKYCFLNPLFENASNLLWSDIKNTVDLYATPPKQPRPHVRHP